MSKKKSKKKTTKKRTGKKVVVESYRHESATRKNIPTAKIAAEGTVPRVPKAKYTYNAHLSPELRFDASGLSQSRLARHVPLRRDRACRDLRFVRKTGGP